MNRGSSTNVKAKNEPIRNEDLFPRINDSDIQLSVRLGFFLLLFFYLDIDSAMIDNREEQLQRVANRLRKVVDDYSTQVR